jgi:hypothetical protein
MKKIYTILLAFGLSGSLNAQIEGTWKLSGQAGSLGVGPALGDISWWSNSSADLTTRACLFDDSITFDVSGGMIHYMDGSTWLEGWQYGAIDYNMDGNIDALDDHCGLPIAPHDGTTNAPYTYTYNSGTGELTVNGVGAHLGLAKVVNGAELTDPSLAPSSITYLLTFANGNNTMIADINFGSGYWRFVYQRTNSVPAANPNITFRVDMTEYTGTIGTGVYLNGSFNSWCGSCAQMTNIGNNIYELVVPLAIGQVQYKFTVDGWTDQEILTAGAPCVDVIADGFDNRAYNVTADAILPNVCFSSCDVCATAAGIEDQKENSFEVSPNPFQTEMTLKFVENNNSVNIYDMSGMLIYTNSFDVKETSISMENINPGIYTLILSNSTGTFSKKIIKE